RAAASAPSWELGTVGSLGIAAGAQHAKKPRAAVKRGARALLGIMVSPEGNAAVGEEAVSACGPRTRPFHLPGVAHAVPGRSRTAPPSAALVGRHSSPAGAGLSRRAVRR